MDPRQNPYAPGAGTKPPELAGRDQIIEKAAIALDRIRDGRAARSIILYGLRGVGKTVLLTEIRLGAMERGIIPVNIEAPEDRSLPSMLIPALRTALLRLSRKEDVKAKISAALRALGSFAKVFKVKFSDVEFAVEMADEAGVADSGDLEVDLADLLTVVGEAAKEADTAVVLFIDELQYIPEEQLAALISALHRTSQLQLPVTLVAAGLPQLLGQMGRAKSYAERLFEFVPVDKLDPNAAEDALCKPAEREGVSFTPEAVSEIIRQTQGYPYFLQEWGKHVWDIAERSPIGEAVAKAATESALVELDQSFFRVRFDRLAPGEKQYLRAMAELGSGPHRSGDIAEKLQKPVSSIAPIRNQLISKGMIYSPSYGDTAFTVPLFDGYMRRTIPF